MKILNRMILREFFPNYFLAQFLLVFVLILNRIFELANLIIGKGVSFLIVFKLFLYTLPFLIFLTIPMSVLVAVIITFGRMGNDFEITAIRSCGINIGHLIRTLFLASIALFIIAYIFADFIVPDANHKMKILLSQIASMKPEVSIEESTVKRTYDNNIEFYFEKISKKGEFENCRIFKHDQLISAPSGYIKGIPENKNLVYMKKGSIFENNKNENKENLIKFDEMYIKLSLIDEKEANNNLSRSDREMSSFMLMRAIEKIENNIDKSDIEKYRGIKTRIYRYLVEIHKKFAIAFGVFAFILLGSVIGIGIKKSGLGVGFMISTILFVIYYIFLVIGEQLSDRGLVHPIITMWFANIITLIISIILLHHALYEMPYKWTEKIIERFFYKNDKNS